MTKIYLFIIGEYSDAINYAAFGSEEKANDFMNNYDNKYDNYLHIEEIDFNPKQKK